MKALVERFAPTRLPVLIVGARGTGKELFAQEIHRRSGRSGELVDVDCPALPRDVADGLLFGFRKGIFTGARESHVGLIEQSNGGTLFLDELLGLDPEAQRKLLRVLETGSVRPLGERTKRTLDLRVVAAVQDDLQAARETGGLREDLFDRLRGVVIELPPLAQRPEDVLPLAEHFVALQGRRLEAAARRLLGTYAWPGNVRELRLAIERAGCIVLNGTIDAGALAEAMTLGAPDQHPERPSTTMTDEDRRVVDACVVQRWDLAAAASTLGVHRATVYRRLRAMGVSPRSARVKQYLADANSHNCRANSRENPSARIANSRHDKKVGAARRVPL
jgi:DNA-binding NtrC family response regulator